MAAVRVLIPALAFALALVACRTSENPGEFGDDAGTDEAAPPDLLAAQCDPRELDGCGDGRKCSYVVDPEFGPSNQCVDLLGEGIAGDPCTAIGESDDCAAHHVCWATEAESGVGTCVPFCDTQLACEFDDDSCSVSNDALLPLCLPRCNPLTSDCPDGWGCYPDAGDRWVCDRDQSGPLGVHGDPCACLNCCDPGLTCITGALVDAEGCGGMDGAAGCCADVCELLDGEPVEGVCATEAERCEPFYEGNSVQMGLEQVGVCRAT